MGDINPQEVQHDADQSVAAEEKGGVENRQERIKSVVDALEEQLKELDDEYPIRVMGEEKACGFEVGSNLMEGVRLGQLRG